MSSHDGKMVQEVSLRQLFKRRLVIPEIQREYVWGDPEIGKRVLSGFFADLIKSVKDFTTARDDVSSRSKDLVSHLQKSLSDYGIAAPTVHELEDFSLRVIRGQCMAEGKRQDSKVGFVYAYIPGFAKGSGDNSLAFLIDGQQRVTTFFLLWLYLAKESGKIDDFKAVVRLDENDMAFGFKVRPLTHCFLLRLVREVVKKQRFDFSAIEDGVWFLSEYRHDVTVMSMSNALKIWDRLWRESELDASVAYEYLTDHVKFWLFVMNETLEGEQLYITMNGRGKSLSEDEVIRAKVFRDAVENNVDATEVGEVFEDIEDFFWNHRISGELTSDKGKRKFFRWVYLLDRYGKAQLKADGETAVDEFAESLRNDRKFELVESMFGRDEKAQTTRVTFSSIKNTLKALRLIFKNEFYGARRYLRNSVWTEADGGQSFQQDAFILLPLLRWIIGVRNGGQDPSGSTAKQLARYLRKMATKHDVQARPADAVPAAIKFADEFVKFSAQGDFLEFIVAAKQLEGERKISSMLLPEEEVYKARQMIDVRARDPRLFGVFVKLINRVEDYKAQVNGNEFAADYQINAFLSLKKEWQKDEWGLSELKFYREAFRKFKAFWETAASPAKMQFLMMPEVGGYEVANWKITPLPLVRILDDVKAINKIVEIQSRIERVGCDVAYNEVEKEFLSKHWANIPQEKDVKILGALSLIAQRIGRGMHKTNWTKLQFYNSFHTEAGYCDCPAGKRAIGADGGLFFWFFDDSRTNFTEKVMTGDRLLAGNEEKSDKLVEEFLAK